MFRTVSFTRSHHPGMEEFIELARRIGIESNRSHKLLETFVVQQQKACTLVAHSYLYDSVKKSYRLAYNTVSNSLAAPDNLFL